MAARTAQTPTATVRTLAIDVGTRRIGLAVSDPDEMIAQPLETLQVRNRKQVLEALSRLTSRLGVERVVVGLPLNMDGSEGEAARAARVFAQRVASALGVPVDTFDERLTTVAAEETLREAGVRGAKRRAVVDRVAAAILLRSYLDERRR